MGRFRGVSKNISVPKYAKNRKREKESVMFGYTECLPEKKFSPASGNCDCWCPCSQNCGSDGFGDNQLKREAEAEAESLPVAVAATGVPEGHSRGIELESGSAN